MASPSPVLHYKYPRPSPPSCSVLSHPMAVVLGCGGGGGDGKENVPPEAPAAASTVRGLAVRKQSMAKKRPACGKTAPRWRRPPLGDITARFLAASPAAVDAAAPPQAMLQAPEAARAGAPGGVAAKQGRLSLRKGFR
ncbi:hypothetical protein ACP4OV_010026 [Aristida adscensionis]